MCISGLGALSSKFFINTDLRFTNLPAIAIYPLLQVGVLSVVFVHCHFVSVFVLWFGGSFAKLGFGLGLCGFENVPPNAWAMRLICYRMFALNH
jgi:hypothetical protein